jgi:hypothetical protein
MPAKSMACFKAALNEDPLSSFGFLVQLLSVYIVEAAWYDNAGKAAKKKAANVGRIFESLMAAGKKVYQD